jgi:cellulase (glycosyl hydrolase family 5)
MPTRAASAIAIAILLLSFASLELPRPAAAQDVPAIPADRPGLKGVVGHWWYINRYGPRLLDEYAALGVTSVRLAVDWEEIEPIQSERHFERLDPIFLGLRDRGIDVLPVIATVPSWAATNGEACFFMPLSCVLDRTKLDAFKITMRELVARYRHVSNWEFWNEPEGWQGMRNPADYEFWYRGFYAAAKEANPSSRVAMSSLTGWDFLGRVSSDVPYDAVTVHSYGDHRGDPIETAKVQRLHDETVARGNQVPVWLTEYGWNGSWLDDRTRVGTLDWTMRWLIETPYIEIADYHMLHDTEEPYECCYGLISAAPSLAPKQPVYDRFRSYHVTR